MENKPGEAVKSGMSPAFGALLVIGRFKINTPTSWHWQALLQAVVNFGESFGSLAPWQENLKGLLANVYRDHEYLLSDHKNRLKTQLYAKDSKLSKRQRSILLELYDTYVLLIKARRDYLLREAEVTDKASVEYLAGILMELTECAITLETRDGSEFERMFTLLVKYKLAADILKIPDRESLHILSTAIITAHEQDLGGIKYHNTYISKRLREKEIAFYQVRKTDPKFPKSASEREIYLLKFLDNAFQYAAIQAKQLKRQSEASEL